MDINETCLPTLKVPCYLLVLDVYCSLKTSRVTTGISIRKGADMHSKKKNRSSTQQQSNASHQDLQEEAHLSGHQ